MSKNKKLLSVIFALVLILPLSTIGYALPSEFNEPCEFGQSVVHATCLAVNELQDQIDTINGFIITIQNDILSLDSRVTVNEGNITALDSRITTNEENVSSLFSSVAQIILDISTNAENILTNQLDITNLQTQIAGNDNEITSLLGVDLEYGTRMSILETDPIRTISISLSNGNAGSVTTFGTFFTVGKSFSTINDARGTAPLVGINGIITNFIFVVGQHTTPNTEITATVFINGVASSISCSLPTGTIFCSVPTSIGVVESDDVLIHTDFIFSGAGSSPTILNVDFKKASLTVEN